MWNQSTKKLMLLNSDLKMITLAAVAVCTCSLLSWKLPLVQAVYMVSKTSIKLTARGPQFMPYFYICS